MGHRQWRRGVAGVSGKMTARAPVVAGLREDDDEMRQRKARSRIRSALSRTLRSDVGVRPEELCAPARCGSLGVDVPLRKKIR